MKLFKLSILCCIGAVAISSCVKQSFNNPRDESGDDPHLTVNTTLYDLNLQALNMPSGQYRVLGDSIVSGIVVADDRSGNFYKQIVIQDTSGGIVITIDKTVIYGDYPVGRKVYVKLKGLILMNYKGLPEITYSVNSTGTTTGIPASLLSNYIIRATFPNTITPIDVTTSDIYSSPQLYYNRLIRLGVAGPDPVEFDSASAGVPYAASTATGAISSTLYITDAILGAKTAMYNSSYASFQPAITPTGSGSVVCVFSNYNGVPQLLLRDTSDVRFTDPRF